MQKSIISMLVVLGFTFAFAFGASAQTSRKSVSAAEVNGTFRMNFQGKFRKSSFGLSRQPLERLSQQFLAMVFLLQIKQKAE